MPTEQPLPTYRRGALPHRLEGVLNLEEVAIGREDRDRPVVARHDGGGGHTTEGRAGSAVVEQQWTIKEERLAARGEGTTATGTGGKRWLSAGRVNEGTEHQASIGAGGSLCTAVSLVCN